MEAKRIIYGLKCPFTNSIHYVGKSTIGMIRPLQHLTKSHSEKINEWVNDLKQIGYFPIVQILENVSVNEDIDSRERYWIQKEINNGGYLLNSNLVSPLVINQNLDVILSENKDFNMMKIATFIKAKRKQIGLTQPEFSEKTGISLKVLRKIEQGRTNIMLDGLIEILRMFGTTIDICKI